MIVKTAAELRAEKKRMEEEIAELKCQVVTLRVTASDYLKYAVQYQCSPWDLQIVRAYGIAKTRLEEILSANAKEDHGGTPLISPSCSDSLLKGGGK